MPRARVWPTGVGPTVRQAAVTAVCVSALLGGAWFVGVAVVTNSEAAVVQPVAFNHKAHVDVGMECADCHAYYDTQTFSGLPTIQDCLSCHDEAITESKEEEAIRSAAAAGEPLTWRRLYTVPDHVYYSHRRHVAAEGVECATCHGAIAESTRPPPRALTDLSMDFCLNCHKQTGASEDCIACHK